MLRWFKRQSTGVQTLTLAVIVVLFLALITSGDEGKDDGSTSAADPAPAVAAEAPARQAPPGPASDEVIAAFDQTGLPVVAPRDTTDDCIDDLTGCVTRVTTDSVTVVMFETVDAAKEFIREHGRDARRNGATVVSYAAARTPNHLRPQYAAVLDAVAKGGDGHAARRHVVSKQRREARRRQLARERRIAEQQAAAERAAAEATPPPAPDPEPAATPDYSGMTCSEIGHSFSVPPGSDPEHDADGDGLACESQ